jgi:hypothetical protein
MIEAKANTQAEDFYEGILEHLCNSGIEFMIGGAFAVFHYSGISRETKDMDIYCRSSDYPQLLQYFSGQGFRTELTDIRWLAKVFSADGFFIDIIFNTVSNMGKVDDLWFKEAQKAILFKHEVLIISVEELIRGKIYVQNRERYDGADINHIWLQYGGKINWDKLKELIEPHWHLLLAQMISFQFVYPHDFKDILPRQLFEALLERAKEQYEMPPVQVRVCRGPLIDQTQYKIDIKEWDYKAYTITTV